MASRVNKSLKKNIILIVIFLSFLVLSSFIFKRYFSQSLLEAENLESGVNVEGGSFGSDGNFEIGKDMKFTMDFFKRESFLNLREYLSKEATTPGKVIATTDDFPPPPEDIFVSDPGTGKKLNIIWNKSVGEKVEKIRVYRFDELDGKGVMVAEVNKTENTFTDTDLVNDKAYYYLVKTVNKQGQMSKNTEKYNNTPKNIVPPGKLLEFSVSQSKEGVVFLWQNPSDDDLEYVNIYKSQTDSELGSLVAKLKAVPAQKQKWIDNDMIEYEEYYYTLLSVDTAENSSAYYIVKLGNKDIFIIVEQKGASSNQ